MAEASRPLHEQDPTGRFTSRAADYAAARPSYPPEAIEAVLGGLGPVATLRVADVGAGTGIASRLIAERGPQVVAVEPNASMRAAAVPHPRVLWQAGSAERTGLADGSVDLVVCAQAFHWFDAERALPELLRVLRPGGRLAVVWNERERRQDPTTAAYSELMRVASEGHPADAAYADPSPKLRAAGLELEPRRAFPNAQPLDLEGLLKRAWSASYVPKEGPAADALAAGLQDLFRRHQGADGRVVLRYATQVVGGRAP
jgi:SAM-dependent methyltransferase